MIDRNSTGLSVRLTRRIHRDLLIDVEFELVDGVGVLFGASGVGKSSLLRLIAGLDRPDRGRLKLGETTFDDVEAGVHLPPRSRRIGMVFQDDLLFPHLDVAANVRFGLRGEDRRSADRRLAEVAELCGIGPLLGRDPSTLSGGERQRVGLARALAPRPRLLLCDEPVSALDEPSRVALIERLKSVRSIEAIPMLYVTHGGDEAVAVGDRLYRMSAGRIVEQGPPLEVLAAGGGGVGGLRNVFRGVVVKADPGTDESRLRLEDGPTLVVPRQSAEPGTVLTVSIRADEILLARERPVGLSARNVLAGVVERLIGSDGRVEVLIGCGRTTWIVSLVGSAVRALAIEPGVEVWLIAKARSFRVVAADS